MRLQNLLLAASLSMLSSYAIESIPVKKIDHFLLLPKVYLNGKGPFRMILDTGAQSSTITPEVAARIGAKPEYRLLQVTLAGQAIRAAGHVSVQLTAAMHESVEMIFSPIPHHDADGILGQSWLRYHSYLLDFERQRLVLDGDPPVSGLRLLAFDSDGRPAVTVSIDGSDLSMVIDSGAPAMVLYRKTPHYNQKVLLSTSAGSIEATAGRARLQIGSTFHRFIDSIEIPASRDTGLLPACIFRSLFVEKGAAQVILLPK